MEMKEKIAMNEEVPLSDFTGLLIFDHIFKRGG